MRSLVLLLIIATSLSGCFGGIWVATFGGPTTLERAEELEKEGKLDEAIAQYQRHIEERLAVGDRPAWENPKFYLLSIGDLRLQQGDKAAALASYEEAEAAEVNPALVADRFRFVASWHETRGELREAQEVLLRYRDRDPLLFNAMLDRLARRIVEEEELRSSPTPTPQDALGDESL